MLPSRFKVHNLTHNYHCICANKQDEYEIQDKAGEKQINQMLICDKGKTKQEKLKRLNIIHCETDCDTGYI